MIGNVIQAKFLESLDYPTAASLSFILMGTIMVMLLIYAKIVGSEKLTG
jgi:spermidine/putrescine transport system permease protein